MSRLLSCDWWFPVGVGLASVKKKNFMSSVSGRTFIPLHFVFVLETLEDSSAGHFSPEAVGH